MNFNFANFFPVFFLILGGQRNKKGCQENASAIT